MPNHNVGNNSVETPTSFNSIGRINTMDRLPRMVKVY